MSRLNELGEGVLDAAVESTRQYVRSRLWAGGRIADLDDVMARVREIVWGKVEDFDEGRGTFGAYVHGIARNVVSKQLASKPEPASIDVPEELEDHRSPDPLNVLVSRYERRRWAELVAEFVGEEDWDMAAELALSDGTAENVAQELGVTVRTLRTVKERVTMTALTVRAALIAADNGEAATLEAAARCLPEMSGVRGIVPYLNMDVAAAAQELRISDGAVRNRVAKARRLLSTAVAVLEREGI